MLFVFETSYFVTFKGKQHFAILKLLKHVIKLLILEALGGKTQRLFISQRFGSHVSEVILIFDIPKPKTFLFVFSETSIFDI